jgi:hypothetical protein
MFCIYTVWLIIYKKTMDIYLQTEAENFGIDWGGPVPVADLDTTVTIPETNCPLTTSDMQALQSFVAPLAPSNEYGMDLYEQTLEFVGRKLGVVL